MKPVFPVNFQPPPLSPAKGKGGDKYIALICTRLFLNFQNQMMHELKKMQGKQNCKKKKKKFKLMGHCCASLEPPCSPFQSICFFAFLTTDFDAPNAKSRTELAD